MKLRVNENCIGCGLCSTIAPEVFTLRDDHASAPAGEIPDADKPSALEAKGNCPVDAIEEV